jgi:hypothetical protein
LELTYLTPKLRSATTDGKTARKMLGEELARSFHSVVADIRDAMYLGEVPGILEIINIDGSFELSFPLGGSSALEVETLGVAVADWSQAHRLRLLRIVKNGDLLV